MVSFELLNKFLFIHIFYVFKVFPFFLVFNEKQNTSTFITSLFWQFAKENCCTFPLANFCIDCTIPSLKIKFWQWNKYNIICSILIFCNECNPQPILNQTWPACPTVTFPIPNTWISLRGILACVWRWCRSTSSSSLSSQNNM